MNRLCHIYQIGNPQEAGNGLDYEGIKGYGDETYIGSHRVHVNHEMEDGWRGLVRCKKCGALLLVQHSSYEAMDSDYDGSFYDWIPVWSEREADLLNLYLDADELANSQTRHLRKNNRQYFWMGDEEPKPKDLDELQKLIDEKYADVIAGDMEGAPSLSDLVEENN